MLEGRGSNGGIVVVGVALIALLGFTGLLYVRGGSGPPIALSGAVGTIAPTAPPRTPAPSRSTRPATSPAGGTAFASPASSPGSPISSSPVSASATPAESSATPGAPSGPAKTPRPSASTSASGSPADSASGSGLPISPQPATVALGLGQGGCPNVPAGGVAFETAFTLADSGRLTVTSPSSHRLSGLLQSDGSFSVSGTNPVERWVGTVTDTGGTGSYFVVSNSCTEGYDTTIAFHP